MAKVDTAHAWEMRLQLEAPVSRLRMETVLVELEDNQKILESLEMKSPAKVNPARQIHLIRRVQ